MMIEFVSTLSGLNRLKLDAFLEVLRETTKKPLLVGSPDACAFAKGLSQRLLLDLRTKQYPELQALGFWLRSVAVEDVLRKYLSAIADVRRVAAGVVFQLPPSNVATLFGYTAVIGLLCGNVVLVRIPSKTTDEQGVLVDLIDETLTEAAPMLRAYLHLVRYDHDDAITCALSAIADVRMVWGSDQTVDHIRQIPLPSLSRHVSFGNRFSAVAISASHYMGSPVEMQELLIKKLFNDIYWFSQMACSSPRLIVWVGGKMDIDAATVDFYPRFAQYASSRGYRCESSECIAKLNFSFLALHDLNATSYHRYNPALTVVTLDSLDGLPNFKKTNYGFGMLLEWRTSSLDALAEFAERIDQTLSIWGFEQADVSSFVDQCGGRGYDRIVSVGDALSFDPIWDGVNLFDSMSRFVVIKR